MNKNINRETEQTVSSKYFTTKSVMDESLSDFQEPKKLSGPKASTQKAKTEKAKKAPKRIRGQKDIRSALKTKKKELERYAEDFDKVCKHAGLDIDSEELQLAIALSKSLQESETDGAETSQSHNTQERVGKIRTTLLEYGFKVPELKKPLPNKRLKKKKNYKLLTTSEEARKQIVSDKFSQILFKNITVSKNHETSIEQTHAKLFNLATGVNYCILKDINTFYVENLLEKSTGTFNLLRDWSEIPGRPVSPTMQSPISMNFSEIDCSQDELDIVLSGSLKCCKNVIKGKEKEIRLHNTDIYCRNGSAKDILDNSVIIIDEEVTKPSATLALDAKECDINLKLAENYTKNNDKVISIEEPEDEEVPKPSATLALDVKECDINLKFAENYTKNKDKSISKEEPIVEVDQYRSCSPDLFEDELSVVEESRTLIQKKLTAHIHTNDVMDLTECDTGSKLNYSNNPVNSQPSQKYNVTNICNDLMEITECIENQGFNTYPSSRNVTKCVSNDFMEITNCVSVPVKQNTIYAEIDLTQSPTDSNKIDIAQGNETIQHDDTIEVKSDSKQTIDKMNDKNNEETLSSEAKNIDLTESPKVAETTETIQDAHIDNPFEIKCDTKHTIDIMYDKKKEEIVSIEPINIDLTDCSKTLNYVANNSVENLDLTQSSSTSDELPFVSLKGTKNNSQASVETIMDPKDYEYQNESIAQDDFLDLTQNHHEDQANSAFDLIKVNQYKNNDINTSVTHHREIVANKVQMHTPRKNSRHSQTSVSFFEEYVHDHSDNNDALDWNTYKDHKDNNKEVPIPDPRTSNVQLNATGNLSDDIDLTQNTDSSESQNYEGIINQSVESESYGDATIEMEICKGPQSDIDLTQNSESEELSQDSQKNKDNQIENELESDATVNEDIYKDREITPLENDIVIKSSQRCSSLGKKDNISIDYDEINDDLANSSSQLNISLTKSATDNLSNSPNKSKDISNCSQNSEVFIISDNELDYSMHKSKLEKPVENFMLGGISIMNEFSGISSFRRFTNIENNSAAANINEANYVIEVEDYNESGNVRTPIKHRRVNELVTPQKPSCSGINTVVTPSNNEYSINAIDVTPMPKYESMSLEELHTELDKYGVKPFKRKRAIQLLTHIYNETHPIIESNSDEESPCKRRKIDNHESKRKKTPRKLTPRKILSPKKTAKSPRKRSANKKSPRKVTEQIEKEKATTINDRSERLTNLELIQCSNNYDVNETPFIKEVHCSPEDWVFQKREKAKVHTCRVPLHIAFHNYVSSRRWLKEAILCYEPVNIDDIHKDLVSYGHRYDPKDLLKFMDKKCITVKTTDNDGRNNKKY